MKDYFDAVAAELQRLLRADETYLCLLEGEESDFVRLNRNRIRQAGHVRQLALELELIQGQRHTATRFNVSGNLDQDRTALARQFDALRTQLSHVPEDPYLNYTTEIENTAFDQANRLPPTEDATATIMHAAAGLDLVGLWASGTQIRGFANSYGQRNWHSAASFNLDWSCHSAGDKAVKCNYAGYDWDADTQRSKIEAAREQLAMLARPAIKLDPGRYRAYLAPQALGEILTTVGMGGFGLKAHRTRQTPLLAMLEGDQRLAPMVNIREQTAEGLTPAFTGEGFLKPARIDLIENGIYQDSLADARSGREYGVAVNAASEYPEALELGGGSLVEEAILQHLDTGLYISNLWYGNFSDPNTCRITGMTRYACFWVENGVVRAPLSVMRFDDSLYNMLGDNLEALTQAREFMIATDTYEQRSLATMRLPGALMDAFTLAL